MEDPLKDWFQANKRFLIALSLGFLAIIGYRQVFPQLKASGVAKSWDLYHTLRSAPPEAFEATGLEETLAQSRGDDRIHPWIALRAASTAAASGDQGAIETAIAELSSIKGLTDKLGVSLGGENGNLWDNAADALQKEAAAGAVIAQGVQPNGATLALEVQIGEGEDLETLKISFKLFQDEAPAGTEALIRGAGSGRWVGAEVATLGPSALRMVMPAEPSDPETLPLERAFGCFHSAGTLGTVVEPGAARNNQKGGELLIHLEDAFSYDGRTSVLGKITDKAALDNLRQLTQAGARAAKIVSATTL